jgi:penicillin-binding protein 1C
MGAGGAGGNALSADKRSPRWRRVRRAGLALLVCLGLFWLVPVARFDDPLSTVVLDRDGELLGALIAPDGQWRFGPAHALPDKFVAAVTRFEDRRFFLHPGVDPIALVRALVQNVRDRDVKSGGSTLTMQVVRLSRKGRPRTYAEKAVEAVMALRLELALSKRQILRAWAAYAPMGGNTVGLDAAAWRYFGRPAERLSWAEMATLTVLPNAPTLIHPGRNRPLLLAKRNRLLDSLLEAGTIDLMTCALAKREPLPPAPQPVPLLAPHLLARIQGTQASRTWRTGDQSPWVRTTLSKEVQLRAAEVLARHHRALDENGVHNAAALVLEVETGRVVAYLGNLSPADGDEHGEHVDVIPAPRSTGSVLKPLLFAAMLDAGEVLPGQLIPDVPTYLGAFHPENFDRGYSGAVPAERALARSLNVPAIRMLRNYGVDRFCSLLRRVGVTTLTRPARDYGLELILGGGEGTLFDVTGVYAGLARSVNQFGTAARGPAFRRPSYLVGGATPSDPRRDEQPLHAGAAYLTLQAMLEVERPGDEIAWRAYATSQKIAWKTGTSFGYRDAWAVGVTPRYAVGVWVGNADGEGRPGLTGYSAAAPILFELFDLLPGGGWFAEPVHDLRVADVCARSGMRAGPFCEARKVRIVPPAGLGAAPCTFCKIVHVDAAREWQVHGDCEPVAAIRPANWFVLPPTMETYYRRRHADYVPPPPFRPDCRAALDQAGGSALSCVYPKEGSQVYVPIEMQGSLGRVVFEAAHRDPRTRVFWHLDDDYLGETRHVHQMALAPAPGKHVLTLVDEAGETVQRTFTVLGRAATRARIDSEP